MVHDIKRKNPVGGLKDKVLAVWSVCILYIINASLYYKKKKRKKEKRKGKKQAVGPSGLFC